MPVYTEEQRVKKGHAQCHSNRTFCLCIVVFNCSASSGEVGGRVDNDVHVDGCNHDELGDQLRPETQVLQQQSMVKADDPGTKRAPDLLER